MKCKCKVCGKSKTSTEFGVKFYDTNIKGRHYRFKDVCYECEKLEKEK